MNKSKGFTIIELIVVIAIIAVLAAIVLVNVTQYLNKGRDAAAKGNLSTMITNSAVYFDDITKGNGTYNGYVTGAGTGDATYVSVYNALVAAGYAVTASCNVALCAATSTNWCASTVLKTDSTKKFCVDSSGAKKESATSTCALGVCPN